MMEMKDFQEKLARLLEKAKAAGNDLKNQEVLDIFGTNQLSASQLQSLYEYLRLQGIRIEGAELQKMDISSRIEAADMDEKEDSVRQSRKNPVVLDEDNKECLREYEMYLSDAPREEEGERMQLLIQTARETHKVSPRLVQLYLRDIIEVARQLYQKELFIGDLIQEGSMVLLTVPFEQMPDDTANEWILEQIREGMKAWIASQSNQKAEDESLVEKVRTLEAAIRELSDDEESKFSVEELSAYLDMDVEEIRSILGLTSEGGTQ
jgi:RNA polymerase primary sigma factor